MRRSAALGSVCGGAGVALGAFGAHALRPRLEAAGRVEVWETAVLYLLVHAVALIAVAAAGAARVIPEVVLRRVALCWVIGTLLFSGSLMLLSLGAGRFWGPITPIGGVLFIAGWVLLAAGAMAGGAEGRVDG